MAAALPLTRVYTNTVLGGDPLNGIEGGGGADILLPGRNAGGQMVATSGYTAQRGDLLVLSLCAAELLFLPSGLRVDTFGNPLPDDTRESQWVEFMLFASDTGRPYAVALALMLTDDFSSITIKYGGGILGFLDEGYTVDIYHGVESTGLVDHASESLADAMDFDEPDVRHNVDQRATTLLAAVGQRNFSGVPGFVSPDTTGQWAQESLTWPGFNTVRLLSWQTPDTEPRGRRWPQYAAPHGELTSIPVGFFTGTGSIPVLLAGILYLNMLPDLQATRQFPRDDAAGEIGGPRFFPPPRSERVTGGRHL